jgi:2-polyprenyl-3-methyl-5-hydroxy-6-metoxy-1,4-benzoquinol methylase
MSTGLGHAWPSLPLTAERTRERDAFDVALVPGMRDRLADGYARFKAHERTVIAANAAVAGTAHAAAYRERSCPMCGAGWTEAALVLSAHGLDLGTCTPCGFTYSRQVMDESVDAARYQADETEIEAVRLRSSAAYLEVESARARYYLARMRDAGMPMGRLLEIGCGTGTLLVEAARAGWQTLGVEPGPAAVAVALERGANARPGYFPADLPLDARDMDAIAVLDVLEHMQEPRGFVAKMREYIRPNGWLFVQVPNFDSLLIRVEGAANSNVCPGHWSYFTPDSLPALLSAEGFAVRHVETVVTEVDRLGALPAADVTQAAQRLRPGSAPAPLDPAWLLAQHLGYKLVCIAQRV